MINGKDNPVEWAMLSYELEDVIEHLKEISGQFSGDGDIDEEDFKVRIGHVYAHLNRIWNARNHIGQISIEQSDQYTQFPKDITLYG